MTLSESTDRAIQETIKEFHDYIQELGIEVAKKIILENTCYVAVKKYVENY